MSRITSINPCTGEVNGTYPEATSADIEHALAAARASFERWREVPVADRARPMREVARLLRAEAAQHARTMALEMGKPIAQGEAEAVKCATACEHYAEHAHAMLQPEPRASDASESFVRFDPLGVVLAVMPWNFPFWQVFRFAAPALMAGNAAILKHAERVPACALAIQKLFERAGFPEGLFTALLVHHDAVATIIADDRVAAATLTGSERAGKSIGEHAGRALKKVVLELGGSDPFVVLEDADVERAARVAVDARLINSGQSCIAAKRFIVVERVADAFVERFVAHVAAKKTGDPLDRATDVGPLARRDLRDDLHRQVEASVKAGARLLTGGAVPDGPGFFYPPTVLADPSATAAAWSEETFGPVAAVVRARDEEHAIQLANDTPYGLGASIWTRDVERAKRIAPRIDAGCVFVNGMVKSDPRLPFGGVKRSGHGRELDVVGLREFVNVKTVWIG